MAGRYTRKIFVCPFYRSNAKGLVRCDGGNIHMANDVGLRDYYNDYCANYDWVKCTLAKSLVAFEEKSKGV